MRPILNFYTSVLMKDMQNDINNVLLCKAHCVNRQQNNSSSSYIYASCASRAPTQNSGAVGRASSSVLSLRPKYKTSELHYVINTILK